LNNSRLERAVRSQVAENEWIFPAFVTLIEMNITDL